MIRRTPLKTRSPMKRRLKNVSFEELAYRRFIKLQLCECCGIAPNHGIRVEAAHTGGIAQGKGTGIKTPWKGMIPLCSFCHREASNSYHGLGEAAFCWQNSIDLPAVIARLREAYGAASGACLSTKAWSVL